MGKWGRVRYKRRIWLGRGGKLHSSFVACPQWQMLFGNDSPWQARYVTGVRRTIRLLQARYAMGNYRHEELIIPPLTRYIQKFHSMRTQLQAISLRIQTVRSNEQMMQSMKGATSLLGSMNRQMNLPALQRIAMEFEKENDVMDQRQEMMDDAIDDVTGLEDEEEGEEVVKEVLDEIGVDLGQAVSFFLFWVGGELGGESLLMVWCLQMGETPSGLQKNSVSEGRVAEAIGGPAGGGGGGADDDLQARLDGLRR